MTELNEGLARQMRDAGQAGLDRLKADWDWYTRTRDLGQEWLDAHGFGSDPGDVATQYSLDAATPTISYRNAIRQILREANGRPVHRKVIKERALALGVRTTVASVQRNVDSSLFRMSDTVSVGNGLWRLRVNAPSRRTQETLVNGSSHNDDDLAS